MPNNQFQVCYDCKKSLPISRFLDGSKSPQGNRVYCDKCTIIRERRQAISKGKEREKQRELAREKYQANKEKYRQRGKLYRLNHLEDRRRYDKEYYDRKHRKLPQEKFSDREQQESPVYNFCVRFVSSLCGALKKRGYTKVNVSSLDALGTSPENAWAHMLRTYEVNYGEKWAGQPYEMDHVIPISTTRSKRGLLELYHYTNLQMLTPRDNGAKNNSLRWKSPYQKARDTLQCERPLGSVLGEVGHTDLG